MLSNSSAGAPVGPLRNSASRNCCVDCRRPSTCRARRRCDRRRRRRSTTPASSQRQLRRGDGVDAGAIHAAQLHRRDPRRGSKPVISRRERRAAVRSVSKPAQRRDAAAAGEQRVAKCRVRRPERGDDADARDAHRMPHGAVRYHCGHERSTRRSGARRAITRSSACSSPASPPSRCASTAPATAPARPTFDEFYARGQKANAAMKTLTARFTETTTSSLLTRRSSRAARSRSSGRRAWCCATPSRMRASS